MANFADWINQDLQEPALPEHRGGLTFTGDNRSVLVGVHVTDGGAPADLSGSVVAHVVRSADGGTVTFNGLLDGSDVSAVLPEACFAYPGRIAVMLQLVDGTTKTTLCRAVYDVVAGETGTSIDPGSVVPDLSDILAMLDEMEQATEAAQAAASLLDGIAPYNTVDLLALYGAPASTTVSGIQFTLIGRNKYRATGTATATAYANVYHMGTGVFVAGKTYNFRVSTTNASLRLAMFFYDSSDTIISGTSQYMSADRAVTVPAGAVKTSVYVRVENGATVNNAEIEFYCITGLSNAELDAKIDSVEAAASAGIAGLQNATFDGIVPYNAVDMIALHGALASVTSNGIQFTAVGRNGYTASGTATADAYANVYHMGTGVFEPGATYHFRVSTTDSNLRLVAFFYDSTDTIISGTSKYMSADRDVTIPDNAVKTSIYVRVENGATVNNAEIEFYCLTSPANAELDVKIDDVAGNAYAALDENGVLYLPPDMWEIGGATFSTSGATYVDDPKRVRTKFDDTIALYPGDVITMDWSKYACGIGVKKADGTYGSANTITDDYFIGEFFPEVHVVVRYADESSVTHVEDINALSQAFRVIRAPHVGKPIAAAWEYGGLYTATGLEYDSATVRRTGLVRVTRGGQISFELPDTNHLLRIFQYDASKNYLAGSGAESYRASGKIITLDKAAYVRLLMKDYNNAAIPDTYEKGARIYTDPINYSFPTKPMLTIIDDDTLSEAHILKVYTQANNEGIKVTFACEPYWVEQGGFAATLRQYEREGFQVTFHCYQQSDIYRPGTQYRDYAAMEADFVTGLQKMQEMGFINYKYFVAPFGSHDADIIALAQKWGMHCLVSIAQRTYEPAVVLYDRWTIPRIGLNQHDADGSVTLAELEAQMDACAAAKGWLLIGTHFDTWSTEEGFDRFHEAVTYAKGKGFDIVTLGEGFERWRKYYDIHELNS